MSPPVVKDGRVVKSLVVVDGHGWREFMEARTSFRYESQEHGGYTATRQNDYWYASRKYHGKLHRKYIGVTAELDNIKLEAAAIALTQMIAQAPEKESISQSNELNNELNNQVKYLIEIVENLRSEVLELRGKLPA